MPHKNKYKFYAGGQPAARVASWCVSLLFAGLLLTLGACTTPGDIGVGLPDANANTGAYMIDTLTIKASTVLRDSVVTSSSTNLIVGQYNDPELGKITAKSYFSLSGAFLPDRTQVFDSVVLVLKPTAYRYGDTTKTQTLVEVHALTLPISNTKYSFASPKLTQISYSPAILNQSRQASKPLVAPVLRARPNLVTLRLPLSDTWGQTLFQAAKDGKMATQDLLDANYFGLALVPGATDNAALIAFGVATTGAAVTLYYHDPLTPGTAVSQDFTLSGRHFYQVTADRTSASSPALTKLSNFSPSLSQVDASETAQRTFIQGALGLVTKLEFPYLANVNYFGDHLIVTNATITASIANGTATGLLPPPLPASATAPPLVVYYTNQGNRLVAPYSDGAGVSYNNGTNFNTGLEQRAYSWSVQQYCQGVINRTIPNNGLILAPYSPESPTRVVLNGPRSATNKLQLRLYFVGNN